MIGTDEVSVENNSLGTSEREYEGIQERPLLGFDDNIIDGDIL